MAKSTKDLEDDLMGVKPPPKKNPKGTFYVENEGQRIGPYQTPRAAKRRLSTETTVRGESGGTGKVPELIFNPRGNKMARGPKRLSPDPAKSAEDDAWDYTTHQPLSKNTVAQNLKRPRGAR